MWKNTLLKRFIFILSVVLIFSACQAAPVIPTETPAPTALPTETMVPATATPEPERVVWVSARQDESVQQIVDTLTTLAQESGIQFQALSALDGNQVQDTMKVVVLDAPSMDVAALASAHPAVQFVAITDQDIQSTGNLSIIKSQSASVLFGGGYLSMLLANDWRGVGLIPSDTPLGTAAAWAFFNGGGYFCGNCSPLVPPYTQFPLLINLPAATDAAGWEAGYVAIESTNFNVAYIDGAITDPQVYTQLAQRGLILLGSGNPPAGIENSWAATVQQDIAGTLKSLWPDLIAGKSVGVRYTAVGLTNINPALLGDGKIQQFHEMATDLMNGLISTEFQPLN